MNAPANLTGRPLGDFTSIGNANQLLNDSAVQKYLDQVTENLEKSGYLHGKNLLLILPDATRSSPMPYLLPLLHDRLAPKAAKITALIALGTHAAMSEKEIDLFFAGPGQTVASKYPSFSFVNHQWWVEETFETVGVISKEKVAELSVGQINSEVTVRINRLVTESDLVLIVGPVFPHEVVGFSGGAKYLFPGVSGKEMIDTSHWLGALITSSQIIGTLGITPVREMINTAAAFIKTPLFALCMVVQTGEGNLHSLSFAKPHSAWEEASAISSRTHIQYLEKPVQRALSIIPNRYNDLWVAAKGMYKVEPVIADGGEVIIYAPHVTEFAYSHKELEEIGYHCKAFFVEQWEKYKHYHLGVLAHSTHLRGAGTYTHAEGEKCRITVTLATGISRERTEAMNLKYLDPSTLDIGEYESDEQTLVIPHAGEILFRLS